MLVTAQDMTTKFVIPEFDQITPGISWNNLEIHGNEVKARVIAVYFSLNAWRKCSVVEKENLSLASSSIHTLLPNWIVFSIKTHKFHSPKVIYGKTSEVKVDWEAGERRESITQYAFPLSPSDQIELTRIESESLFFSTGGSGSWFCLTLYSTEYRNYKICLQLQWNAYFPSPRKLETSLLLVQARPEHLKTRWESGTKWMGNNVSVLILIKSGESSIRLKTRLRTFRRGHFDLMAS